MSDYSDRINGKNHKREQYDYYATDSVSVDALLKAKRPDGSLIIPNLNYEVINEPCVGGGHIVEAIKTSYPKIVTTLYDIVDRGYENTQVVDYLKLPLGNRMRPTWTITNPPYKFAKEFVMKALEESSEGVAMFLKISFLAGVSRTEIYEKYPPEYVLPFVRRQKIFKGGDKINPVTNKPWGTGTMDFAWFVWTKGYKGETKVKRLHT